MGIRKFLAVCTVKNEGAFILEWLAWNRLIGFTDFLIFQNGSTDGTKELLSLLASKGLVTYVDNDGANFVSPQRYSYRKASQSEVFKSADWAMALDIDEFVRIDIGNGTVQDLVNSYPADAEEIRLNWRNFGNNDEISLSPDLVINRFTQTLLNHAFERFSFPTKTIFRPASFARFGVHSPKDHAQETWASYNGSGDRIELPENVTVGMRDPKMFRRASVHHYIVKDIENFVLKCDRGKSGHPKREMKTKYWRHWNAKGQIDLTLKHQADRVRAEIKHIDQLCDGKAIEIQNQAFAWRQSHFAHLMDDPEYAQIVKDICDIENHPVPENVVSTLKKAALLPASMPQTTKPTDPNLDFTAIKELAEQTYGGEFYDTGDHVVVHIPGRQRLVFGFDNLSSMSEPGPRKPWAFDLVRQQGWGVLGVMTKKNDWFRSTSLHERLEEMRDRGVFSAYPEVSMYGASMGAFGAAVFAPLAPGCTVLCFAPQSTLDTRIAPFENRYRFARRNFDWQDSRYRDAAEGIKSAGKAYLVYDSSIAQDRQHAQRLMGNHTQDLGWPFLTHKIPPRLKLMRILKPVALEGLNGTLSRRSYCQLMRNRRDCNAYLIDMISGAAARGHITLASRALDQVLTYKNNWKTRQLARTLRKATAVSSDNLA